MDENRMRILKMVEEGKVTADDGARLLEAVRAKGQEQAAGVPGAPGRCLRVRIFQGSTEKPQVNVTVPLALAKLAVKFIPRSAVEQLNEQGIKVEDLEQIIAGVENAGSFRIVDVEQDNQKIEVFVE